MKKTIITTILASALLSFPCLGYAEYTDLDENAACYEAASRLKDFGIMGGYDDGTFRPNNAITRAEVARLVASALGFEQTTYDDYNSSDDAAITGQVFDIIDNSFPDVPSNHWANKYISFLVSEGAINGYEDGTFRPEDKITYAEIAKILVYITGYSSYANNAGGYPNGYMTYASNLKITDGISFSITDNAKRSDVAIMLNNTLDVPMVVISGYDFSNGTVQGIYEVLNGEGDQYQTLLTRLHDIYTVNVTVDDKGEN